MHHLHNKSSAALKKAKAHHAHNQKLEKKARIARVKAFKNMMHTKKMHKHWVGKHRHAVNRRNALRKAAIAANHRVQAHIRKNYMHA